MPRGTPRREHGRRNMAVGKEGTLHDEIVAEGLESLVMLWQSFDDSGNRGAALFKML